MKLKILSVAFALLVLFASASCGGKNPPTIAATVATHGTTLMAAVKATQQAVIDGEATGLIPRAAAIKSMEVFRTIGATGEEVAKSLHALASLPSDGTDAKTAIDKIQAALDLIQTQLFAALVPIGNEAVRSQIGRLAAEVSKTIAIINRMILGGA